MGETAKLHGDLEALIGSTIHDRYQVETLLGSGGMGAVFKARHTGLQRGVAIKLLHPEIGRDPSVSKRFDREAHSASRLDHPNCVRVTDFGTTENGTKYLVMELLEGGDLDGRMGQPWPPDRAVATIEQVLYGLEHAHHVGVVHRDLKPENIFLTKDFRGEEIVKIVDFGIAKLIDEQGSEKLTRQGVVFGTPRYMSPEQAAGGKIDERTDLYAVGLILYELLAGQPPFVTDDAAQLLRMHIMAPPPPLPASVPEPLATIVEKLLEKSKVDRFASAREVLDALAQIRDTLTAAPCVAAAPSVAASSGVAWQPAPDPSPVPRGATLVAETSELAAVSMSAARRTITGSHSGVGQPGTGPFAALPTGPHSTITDASHSFAGTPIVTQSVSVVATAPSSKKRALPIALASVVVLLAIVGLGTLLLRTEQPARKPVEVAEPAPAAAAIEQQPAADEPAPELQPQDSKTTMAPTEQPVAGPTRSSRPVRPSGKSEQSRSKSGQVDTNTTPDTPKDATGGPTPSTAPTGGREATAEQQKRDANEREPTGTKPDADRDQDRDKHAHDKAEGKGKGKKKPE